MTDTSDAAVGTVLQQLIDGHWHPIAYFSKALKPAETRYSTYDRELLAVYLAVKHFRYFIEGHSFHVLTDYKPLVYALHTRSDKQSPRQTRHLSFIAEFTSDIRHVKGSANAPADALSRIEPISAIASSSPPFIDFGAMAAAQDSDVEITRLRTSSSSLKIESIPLARSDATIP